ncbi:TlpA family protein disulfide reductase [Ferruginibacter yonginensis]|uniref:TlpA family protein disulfide reductase n=1 Tax=Ferruginibacter yonginensis TaxID=1310416 RepID=A0ABV8QPT7_9BACT
MTRILFFIAIICSASIVKAQTPAEPAYKRITTIPPFKLMVAPDSTAFTKEALQKKKATIIMVFSPECDHCLHATEDMLAHFDAFKKVQIVMSTPLAYSYVQKFYKDYQLAKYPNITVGVDVPYFLGTFFEVQSYPAIFLYDKKGQFKAAFNSDAKFEDIAKQL